MLLYAGVRDSIFSAPGEWSVKGCPNPACGLVWLDPRPVEEDIGKAYDTYYTHDETHCAARRSSVRRLLSQAKAAYLAHRYGYGRAPRAIARLLASLVYLSPGHRADVDFSVMYSPAKPGGRLLDVGCGNGEFLVRMRALGWRAEGIDRDPVAVEAARGRGLDVQQGAFDATRYPHAAFDAVTLSHVLEHVLDPLELLKDCRRVLKGGGLLAVVTPNSQSWGHRMFRSSWLPLDPPRHLTLLTPSLLRSVAVAAGFQRVAAWTSIRDADWIFIASRSLRRTGAYTWGSRAPRHLRFCSRVLQLVEWALLKPFPTTGEEIVMIANRP